ncbi:MAG: hypothetical protein K2H12_05955, partial [Acetatifactor sp.]|nr:hypothetical protein [Acetatifactor sp.]
MSEFRTHAKRLWQVLFLAMAGMLCLAACGRQEGEYVKEESTVSEAAWKTAGFAVTGQVEEEQGLWVEEYIPIVHREVPSDKGKIAFVRELGTYDSSYYRLYCCSDAYGELSLYYLEQYDMETEESSLTELTPEAIGLEDLADTDLWNGCVTGDGMLVFQRVSFDEGENGKLCLGRNEMLYTSLDGTVAQA